MWGAAQRLPRRSIAKDFNCIFPAFVVLSELFWFRQKRHRPMYRCYFTQEGRVARGCNLKVATLDAAIATGHKILADHVNIDECDGLEIWLDQALLYKFNN